MLSRKLKHYTFKYRKPSAYTWGEVMFLKLILLVGLSVSVQTYAAEGCYAQSQGNAQMRCDCKDGPRSDFSTVAFSSCEPGSAAYEASGSTAECLKRFQQYCEEGAFNHLINTGEADRKAFKRRLEISKQPSKDDFESEYRSEWTPSW